MSKEQTQHIGTIKISDFALRHFDPKFGGTKILNLDPVSFEQHLNTFKDIYFNQPEDRMIDKSTGHVRVDILDGYAPFCKLLVMSNATDCRTGTLPITLENYQYLRSGYSARRDSELPVLSRWLELPLGKPKAKYTVTILYSKEQIDKEAKSDYNKKIAKGGIDNIGIEPPTPFEGDWGVVAIQGTMYPKDDPIPPVTMIRNHLGLNFGGSGVKINDEEYEKSVIFWKKNAIVK